MWWAWVWWRRYRSPLPALKALKAKRASKAATRAVILGELVNSKQGVDPNNIRISESRMGEVPSYPGGQRNSKEPSELRESDRSRVL